MKDNQAEFISSRAVTQYETPRATGTVRDQKNKILYTVFLLNAEFSSFTAGAT